MNRFVERPREPLCSLTNTPEALGTCLNSLSYGTGPVAFDAERAHGHQYWPEAYLFQIRREEADTWLIDPIALGDGTKVRLGRLVDACSDTLWIIHTASQDPPCTLDVGIRPPALFDTELAGRLLGAPPIGLATLLETKLSIRLCEAHSADS